MCTFVKIGEKRVSFSFRESSYALEVLKGWLHKPFIKGIKILRDFDFGRYENVIESKLA